MTKTYSIAIDARRLRATTGRYVRELLENLQKIDSTNQYHMIIHTDDVGHWQPSSPNFKLHVVEWDHYTFGEQFGFNSFLNGLSPDLVHFTMPQQPGRYRGKKVTTIHDLTLLKFDNPAKNKYEYAFKKRIFRSLLEKVAKTSLRILTDAEYTRAEIVSFANVPAEKIVIAQPAADAMATKAKTYEPAENMEFIIYAGNTFPYKNIERLIESHQKLLATHPKLNLLIIGKIDKNVEHMQKLIAKNGYSQVHFTGFVTEEELAWLYKNAKAYVFPSLSEGFGMPGLEAMQFDLPVVSSNATCLPEIYGDAAHYFDPENVDEMTSAINDVLTNDELRQKLIQNGRTQRSLYSWEKMAQIIHDVYADVLSDG